MRYFILLLTLCLATSSLPAQGPLTPPGAPAATMKTLEQIEGRTDILTLPPPADNSAAHEILLPGSYYLSRNLVGVTTKTGIKVAVRGVTIDLNGFFVSNTNGNVGIYCVSRDVVIQNGIISGYSDGIRFDNGGRCERVRATRNVCGFFVSGLSTESTTFRDCEAIANGDIGFQLLGSSNTTFSNCIADFNGGEGFSIAANAHLTQCSARLNSRGGMALGSRAVIIDAQVTGNGDSGILVDDESLISRCNSSGNGLDGITAGAGAHVTDCVTSRNAYNGITVYGRAHITGSTVSDNDYGGINFGAFSHISRNTVFHNGRTSGLSAPGLVNASAAPSGCRVVENQVQFNTGGGILVNASDKVANNTSAYNGTDYSPASGPNMAPVQSAASATNPLANF